MTESRRFAGRHVVAVVASGFVALVLMVPFGWSINGEQTCSAVFGYQVPCSWSIPLAGSLLVMALTGIVLSRRNSNTQRTSRGLAIVVPLVVGLVVLALLYPKVYETAQCDTLLFEFDVPCNPVFSIVAAGVSSVLTWVALQVKPRTASGDDLSETANPG